MKKYIEQFIPATTPVVAVFKDGEEYPVICWMVDDISGENKEDVCLVVIGMIFEQESKYLSSVDESDGFLEYRYVVQ